MILIKEKQSNFIDKIYKKQLRNIFTNFRIAVIR